MSKYLNREDSMNLAETCERMRDIVNMFYQAKYHNFHLLFQKETDYERIFSHIGPHIVSLFIWTYETLPSDGIHAIVENCTQLKKLTLSNMAVNVQLVTLDNILDEIAKTEIIKDLTVSTFFNRNTLSLLKLFNKVENISLSHQGQDYFELDILRIWSPYFKYVKLNNMEISLEDLFSIISQRLGQPPQWKTFDIRWCSIKGWAMENDSYICKHLKSFMRDRSVDYDDTIFVDSFR